MAASPQFLDYDVLVSSISSVAEKSLLQYVNHMYAPFHKRSFGTTSFCYLALTIYRCARKIEGFVRDDDTWGTIL